MLLFDYNTKAFATSSFIEWTAWSGHCVCVWHHAIVSLSAGTHTHTPFYNGY
jgi:hypothetical protein